MQCLAISSSIMPLNQTENTEHTKTGSKSLLTRPHLFLQLHNRTGTDLVCGWEVGIYKSKEGNPFTFGSPSFYSVIILRALASWSGQEVGLPLQLIPSRRAITSLAFIPLASLATPWVLPLQPPMNSMLTTVLLLSSSMAMACAQTPCVRNIFLLFIIVLMLVCYDVRSLCLVCAKIRSLYFL